MTKQLSKIQTRMIASVLANNNTWYCSSSGETNAFNNLRKKGWVTNAFTFLTPDTITADLKKIFFDDQRPAFYIEVTDRQYLIFYAGRYIATSISMHDASLIVSSLMVSLSAASQEFVARTGRSSPHRE